MSYQILAIFLPLLTTPYISRVLGADGVGIYNYVESVSAAFVLFAVLGTNSYAIREVAYRQENKKAYSQIFYEICCIRIITTFLLFPIYFLMIVKVEKYSLVYAAALLNLMIVPFDISWFFQGLEEFSKIVTRNFLCKIIALILIFALVKKPDDVVIYAFIMFGVNLLSNITMWFYLPKYVEPFKRDNFCPKHHIRGTLIFFIPTISAYIYTSLDKIVLGVLSNEYEVGYYSQSEKIVKLLMTIIYALSTVIMPRMANIIRKGEIDKVKENINRSYQFVLLLSIPMIVGLMIVADYFIPLFLGNGYEKCIVLIYILAPLILIMGISSMTGTAVMIAMGMQGKYNSIIIGASIINLLLNLILVKKFNSFGVAFATIIAELFVMSSEVTSVKNLINFTGVIKYIIKYGINSLIMGIVVITVKQFLVCSWISIMELSLIGAFIYLAALLIERDSLIMLVWNMIKHDG